MVQDQHGVKVNTIITKVQITNVTTETTSQVQCFADLSVQNSFRQEKVMSLRPQLNERTIST